MNGTYGKTVIPWRLALLAVCICLSFSTATGQHPGIGAAHRSEPRRTVVPTQRTPPTREAVPEREETPRETVVPTQYTPEEPAFNVTRDPSIPNSFVENFGGPAEQEDRLQGIPHFIGDFFATGVRVNPTPAPTPGFRTLEFLSVRAGTNAVVVGNPLEFFMFFPFNGPDGFSRFFVTPPFVLSVANGNTIVFNNANGDPPFALQQYAPLTAAVQAAFPGAVFISGTGTLTGTTNFAFPRTADNTTDEFSLLYRYQQPILIGTPGSTGLVAVLANPSGGGMVGRNKYFENGSAVPQQRVYFYYTHANTFQGTADRFNVNRCVVGAEQPFFGNTMSVEVRLPFAGTMNPDQTVDRPVAIDRIAVGNVGIHAKYVPFRTDSFLTSLGLGLSLPTAAASRMLSGTGDPLLTIQNRAMLLQPTLGLAWAPTDRFYAQFGMQFDFDPTGNPVKVRRGSDLTQVGVIQDRSYMYLSSEFGYWLYRSGTPSSFLSGVACQGELHYNRSLGNGDVVQQGNLTIADFGSDLDILNATAGLHCQLGRNTRLALGVSFPLTGDRITDWAATAQLNYQFGGR